MAVLPLIMTTQGLQPQAPADLRNQLLASVAATNPDYTANLPGSLIEDIASTDIAACVQSDSFLVDLVNSIAPNGANPFLLQQFGLLYGLEPQGETNTSIYVTFYGPAGFIIVQGFTVSDGTYQYVVQDGGIIGTDGVSMPLYAVATVSGSWAVPIGSVTQLVTSVPTSVADLLSCSNVIDGTPSIAQEEIFSFRDRVMTAGLASSTGMSRYLKTLVGQVPGVQSRLISARQDPDTGKFVVLVGGGDPYQVAYAIWRASFWPGGFIGATIHIVSVSSSNPAVIFTAEVHSLVTGMKEAISGVQGTGMMGGINNTPQNPTWLVTVIDNRSFSVPYDTSSIGTGYTMGGTVTPNPINEIATLTDYPDSYAISFVLPIQETVYITVIWETDSPNYIAPTAIASAAAPALVDYVNSLAVGITPINFYSMTEVFLDSIAGILPAEAVTVLNFEVSILDQVTNTVVPIAPPSGTGVVYGDPNSYFYTTLANITIKEGGFRY